MALSSASRASAIHHLDLRYRLRPEGKFVFTFHKLYKSWKYGKTSPRLEFCEYTKDRDIYVATTLNEYIKRTYQGRAEKRCSQSLLSFIQPYVELSGSTVSRWMKVTLKLTGIVVPIFKGHSTRAALVIRLVRLVFLWQISLEGVLGAVAHNMAEILKWANENDLYQWMRMIYIRKLFLVNINLHFKQRMEDWAPFW